jgi:general stress protein 26
MLYSNKEGRDMNPVRHAKAACVVLALALFVLTLVSDVRAQEGEIVVTPRDTLLTAAKDIMKQTLYCVLITLDESGHPRARAMDPFFPDENMVIWMGTDRKTRKVKEIKNDPRVTLYYPHPQGAGYVTVYGTAEIVDDPELKKRYFKEAWARFYSEEREGFILISVTPNKMEVLDYNRGITGNLETWITPSVKF